MEEATLSSRWTEIPDSRGWLRLEMDQGVAWQPQAKVPLLVAQVVKQVLMHEATVCKQGDHLTCGHDGTHLIEYWLVVFKTDLCAPMAQGSPSQWNGATTIHEGGTNQDKGGEGSRIQGHVKAMI